MQPHATSLDARNSNDIFQQSRNPVMLEHYLERVRLGHLEAENFNDEKTSSFKFTIIDLDEIDILRMQLAKQ